MPPVANFDAEKANHNRKWINMTAPLTLPVGVCSWSLDRNDCLRAIEIASDELNVSVLQLGFFTRESLRGANADQICRLSKSSNMLIPSIFIGFENEDYSSIESITTTGGLLPDEFYDERLAMMRDAVDLAFNIHVPTIAIHVGTLPNDTSCPDFMKLVDRCSEVAQALAGRRLQLLLETGRESIDTLLQFIQAVGRDHVAVNYDSGNLMIYGVDDPVKAVSKLKGCIEMVHLKDAKMSDNPGVDYGQAAAMGTGDVQIPRVISKLRTIGYTGPLLIENNIREGGLQPIKDGIKYIRSMIE